MTTLPAEVEYGYVVGRFLIAQGDGADADRTPDAIAAAGTVKLTPVATITRTTTAPSTILKAPISCTIAQGGDGWMVDPQGNQGVWLVVGMYDVTFQFTNATLGGFRVEVTTAHTLSAPLDLTLAAPLVPTPATVFVFTEQVRTDVLAAAAEVEALVEGIGNPVLSINGQPAGPGGDIELEVGGVSSWAEIEALPDKPALVVDGDARLANQRVPVDGSVTLAKLASAMQASIAKADASLNQTQVDARVQQIVDAAPAALDTLNELAAAIGDDANFAATVTTALAGKAPTTHSHAQGEVTGLSTSLGERWRDRGTFASATPYAVNDVIRNNNGVYRCMTAHTSGAGGPTVDGDVTYWERVGTVTTTGLVWSASSITSGTFSYDRLPAGSVIFSTNAAARPTSRADLMCQFLTTTDPSAVALANDVWLRQA